jgi:hypothetical protein
LRFIRNSIWAKSNNFNNPPPDLKVLSRIFFDPILFDLPVFQWRLLS